MIRSFLPARNIIKRRVLFTALIILAAMLQQTQGLFLRELPVRVWLLLPVAVCIGMFERTAAGAVFGILAGALWDISSSTDGFNTLALFCAARISGVLIKYVMRNNLITALALCAGSTAVYTASYILIFYAFRGVSGIGQLILSFYLPAFVCSLCVCIPVYSLVRSISLKDSVSRSYRA